MNLCPKRLGVVLAGLVLTVFAAIFFLVSLLAIIDPVGTKMADDNDPFGSPPSRLSSVLLCGGAVGLFFLGAYLMKWKPRT